VKITNDKRVATLYSLPHISSCRMYSVPVFPLVKPGSSASSAARLDPCGGVLLSIVVSGSPSAVDNLRRTVLGIISPATSPTTGELTATVRVRAQIQRKVLRKRVG
jgi:hypothetical protein